MTAVQRFFAGDRNAIRTAALAASNVRASATVRPLPPTRTGNGRVKLTGSYSGHEDSTFDVEILAGGSTARVTQPVLAGVGSGSLTNLAATSGVAAQTFTVKLVSTGTDTAAAELALSTVYIRAAVAGAGGNAIALTVNESALAKTAAAYALHEDWSAGTPYQEGDQWNFGGKPLLSTGALAPGTPRILVGDDPQVFRPYRTFEDGVWRDYLAPAPPRTLPKGARVQTLTGSRTVTVTDGVTPEVYPSIITTYDLCAALGASALVEVAGVVANDQSPSGMASEELALRTVAWAMPVQNEGSSFVRGLDAVTISPGAPTQNLKIECTENGILGAEKWSVSGDVSGDLAQAVTGVAYSAAGVAGFTIPTRVTPGQSGGEFTLKDIIYTGRQSGEPQPAICVDRLTLGAKATDRTITLTYRVRAATADCVCDNATYSGRIHPEWLGLTTEGQQVTQIADGHAARLTEVAAWYSSFALGNTQIESDGELRSSINDLELARGANDILRNCLEDIYSDTATRDWTPRADSTAYVKDKIIEPAVANGYRYRVTTAGTTGASPPTFPTTVGATVNDGTAVLTCLGKKPEASFDALLLQVKTDGALLETMGAGQYEGASIPADLAVSTSYSVGDKRKVHRVMSPSFTLYIGGATATWQAEPIVLKCIVAGSLGSTTPSVFADRALSRGDIVSTQTSSGPGPIFVVLGTIGGHAEDNQGAASSEDGIATTVDSYLTRYRAAADEVRAAAGLVKKSDATATGSGVWQDLGGNYWEVDGKSYLPAFTNHVYHAAKKLWNADSEQWEILATEEYAFVIKMADTCIGYLKDGDQIILQIGAIGARSYQVGDRFTLPIVAAGAAYLAGGVTGNDTHTWAVTGSVVGALPNYAVVHGAEALYNQSGLSLKIFRGGIPYALGDEWRFAVEAGQYRWRQNAGIWSAAADIPASGAVALADGLSAEFQLAAAPNFAAGDAFPFQAIQPNAPSHLQNAFEDLWRWSGASATLTATLGASQTIDAVVLARHTLPSGATVTVEGSNDGGATWPLTQALTWRSGPIAVLLATPWTANRLRLVIGSAADAAIGWWWAGEALALSVSAESSALRTRYAMSRGGGINPSALYAGKGSGGSVEWNGWLTQADLDAIELLADHCKQAGDEPLVYLPHHLHPDEAALVKIGQDDLDISDEYQFQPNDRTERRIVMSLPLDPVIE